MPPLNNVSTIRTITTPKSPYQSITAGNWTMPRAPHKTNIVVNNYYGAWENLYTGEPHKGFFDKVADFTNNTFSIVGIASSVVGTIGGWLGLGGDN